MRNFLITVVVSLGCYAGTATAVEPISEAHAMVYYQIPFSGTVRDTRHSFGMRVDRITFSAGQTVDYQSLLQRPAAVDMRFDYHGMQTLNIGGTDYVAMYRVHRQNEGDSESSEEPAEEEPIYEEPGLTFYDVVDAIPFGFWLGGAIGVVILTGVSD